MGNTETLRASTSSTPLPLCCCRLRFQRGKHNIEWKRRYFVVHNRSRNYELEYKTATDETKGVICMIGMSVQSGPDLTLVLEPADRRRVFYLKAADKFEHKRWKYILQVPNSGV